MTMTPFTRWIGTSRILLLIALSVALAAALVPRLTVESVARDGEVVADTTLPISADARGQIVVRLLLDHRAFQTPWMRIHADDCVGSFQFNGTDVPLESCDDQIVGSGFVFDSSKLVRGGINVLELRIDDTHGGVQGLDVTFPIDQGLLLWLRCLIIASVCVFVLHWAHRATTGDRWILGIVLFGLLLRIIYNTITPFDVRGHDVGGHIDYIRYIADNWGIPPGGGYEYHQAPLYYALVAPVFAYAQELGWSETQGIIFAHQLSLVFSLLTVLIIVWAGTIFFHKEKDAPWLLRVFLLIALAVPRSAMLSSPLSNDALILFVVTLSAGSLVRFSKTGKEGHWYAAVVAFAIAFLVKLNAVVLLPAYVVAIALRRARWTKNLRSAFFGGVLLVLLVGWLPIVRMTESEGDLRNVVNFGKGGGNNTQLLVGQNPIRFAFFNPIGVLQHPYNDPWSDEQRRMFFWEYLLRGSMFGEFSFGNFAKLAPYLLASVMTLCCYGFVGFDRAIRTSLRKSAPIIVMTISVLVAAVAYAYKYPYSSEQDFRFSPLLVILVPYFIALGIAKARAPWRKLGIGIACFYAVLCGFFFLLV